MKKPKETGTPATRSAKAETPARVVPVATRKSARTPKPIQRATPSPKKEKTPRSKGTMKSPTDGKLPSNGMTAEKKADEKPVEDRSVKEKAAPKPVENGPSKTVKQDSSESLVPIAGFDEAVIRSLFNDGSVKTDVDLNESTTESAMDTSSADSTLLSGSQSEADESFDVKAVMEGQADTKDYGNERPPYSHVALIAMAIESGENKMRPLCGIYEWIMDRFPFFRENTKRWQNSLRHALSHNDCFVKVPREDGDTGRGSLWKVHEKCDAMFKGEFGYQRRTKRFKLDVSEGGRVRRKRDRRRSSVEKEVEKEADTSMVKPEGKSKVAKKKKSDVEEKPSTSKETPLPAIDIPVMIESILAEASASDQKEPGKFSPKAASFVAPVEAKPPVATKTPNGQAITPKPPTNGAAAKKKTPASTPRSTATKPATPALTPRPATNKPAVTPKAPLPSKVVLPPNISPNTSVKKALSASASASKSAPPRKRNRPPPKKAETKKVASSYPEMPNPYEAYPGAGYGLYPNGGMMSPAPPQPVQPVFYDSSIYYDANSIYNQQYPVYAGYEEYKTCTTIYSAVNPDSVALL